LVAPTVRSFSAEFEPLELLAQFPGTYPGLLESGGGGRFDILPISSGECLRLARDRRLSGPHAAGAEGFLGALDAWWASLRTPASTGTAGTARSTGAPRTAATPPPLPFTGGWLLYLGYELAVEVEPRLELPPSPDPVIALAIRTPAAWILDRASGQAWLIAEPGAGVLLDTFETHVRQLARGPQFQEPEFSLPEFQVSEEDPTRFLDSVSRTLSYIAAGDVYQVNLSRRWRAEATRPFAPAAVYRRLRSTNPSPFAAMMQDGGFAVMSSSPERLLSIRGGVLSTRPIAGTRPRGASQALDAALIEALLRNEKERAEHVMLIDLERNDMGRVCAAGSVRVDEFMALESYAHVHHIVSNLSGRLRAQVTPVGAVRAMFPGGTITGCPKVRCMQIIAELEGAGRGAYTGSIGYLNRDGGCDLNILIRTLTATTPTTLDFRAGAGIVADSLAVQELAETRAKALGLCNALNALSALEAAH
jgi:anthranilate synthase component 1